MHNKNVNKNMKQKTGRVDYSSITYFKYLFDYSVRNYISLIGKRCF